MLRYRIFAKRIEKQQKKISFRKDHFVYLGGEGAQTGKTPEKIIQSNPYENLSFVVVFNSFCKDPIP